MENFGEFVKSTSAFYPGNVLHIYNLHVSSYRYSCTTRFGSVQGQFKNTTLHTYVRTATRTGLSHTARHAVYAVYSILPVTVQGENCPLLVYSSTYLKHSSTTNMFSYYVAA